MNTPAVQAVADALDATEPLADIARGLVAALHWWGADRAESQVGRVSRPDPEAIAFLAVPVLDYSLRAAAAVRRAKEALGAP